jgi:hypothetical protein
MNKLSKDHLLRHGHPTPTPVAQKQDQRESTLCINQKIADSVIGGLGTFLFQGQGWPAVTLRFGVCCIVPYLVQTVRARNLITSKTGEETDKMLTAYNIMYISCLPSQRTISSRRLEHKLMLPRPYTQAMCQADVASAEPPFAGRVNLRVPKGVCKVCCRDMIGVGKSSHGCPTHSIFVSNDVMQLQVTIGPQISEYCKDLELQTRKF